MFHVQELCDIAIWIDKGEIKQMGDSHKVVGDYENFCNNKKSYTSVQQDLPAVHTEKQPDQSTSTEQALQDCKINSLSVCNTKGDEITAIDPLSDLVLEMEVEVLNDSMEGHFGFAFMRSAEEPIASFLTTNAEEIELRRYARGEVFKVRLVVEKVAMRVGEFYVLGGLADKSGLLWYETKFSTLLSMNANKGVGPMTMRATWTLDA
jgi:ABC-type glutathione transport system ATPase component